MHLQRNVHPIFLREKSSALSTKSRAEKIKKMMSRISYQSGDLPLACRGDNVDNDKYRRPPPRLASSSGRVFETRCHIFRNLNSGHNVHPRLLPLPRPLTQQLIQQPYSTARCSSPCKPTYHVLTTQDSS